MPLRGAGHGRGAYGRRLHDPGAAHEQRGGGRPHGAGLPGEPALRGAAEVRADLRGGAEEVG